MTRQGRIAHMPTFPRQPMALTAAGYGPSSGMTIEPDEFREMVAKRRKRDRLRQIVADIARQAERDLYRAHR